MVGVLLLRRRDVRVRGMSQRGKHAFDAMDGVLLGLAGALAIILGTAAFVAIAEWALERLS